MRKHKRVLAQFSFYDRTGISSYLEKMAMKGWMLERVTKFFWVFKSIEPKNIHFAVSYFSKTSGFEPEAPEALLRFREFCEHSGWVFCTEAAQMQIFYNESPEPLPIETDALLEIECIHRGVKKQFLPAQIAFVVCAVLNGGTALSSLFRFPLNFLSNNVSLFSLIPWLFLLLTALSEIFRYFMWRRKALEAAKRDGSFIPTNGNRIFALCLLYVLLAAFTLLILSEWNSYVSIAILAVVSLYFALLLIVLGISDAMKRKKLDAGTNVTVTVILSVVLSIVVMGFSTWSVTALADGEASSLRDEDYVLAPDEYYTVGLTRHTANHHRLPLYTSDISKVTVPPEAYSNTRYEERSFLMESIECISQIRADMAHNYLTSPTKLTYTIYDFKYDFLTEIGLEHILTKYEHPRYVNKPEFRAIDAEAWGADEVYQLYKSKFTGGTKTPDDSYIICWSKRIVLINLPDEPSEAEIAIIAEKLSP